MPLIEPERLLNCLSPLLDTSTGGIKSEREVDKIYGLMSKYSRKLVSKCIYINILKVTAAHILDLFMTRGGWEMLGLWLADANSATNRNCALILELLVLLDVVPATVDRLKQFETGKAVKALSKDASMPPAVQENAKQLLHKWMAIVAPPAATAIDQTPGTDQLDEDLTGLDMRDLNSLQFDPDNFNNLILDTALDQPGGLGEVTELIPPVGGEPPLIDDPQQYHVNNRDGKMYIKMNTKSPSHDESAGAGEGDAPKEDEVLASAEQAEEAGAEAGSTGERKRARKDPTIKKVPGGKPPLRTYEHLYEDKDKKTGGAAADKAKPQKAKGGKPPMGYSPPAAQEKEKEKEKSKEEKPPKKKSVSPTKSSDASSKKATPSGGSGLSKSQREAEEARQLRIKVKEQKRIAEERRKKADQEAQLKAQKARDEETLKSLNLVALGPPKEKSGSAMGKIPKKPAGPTSFADAIGIPGAGIEKTSKSLTKKTSTASEEKQKAGFAPPGPINTGAAIGGERQRVVSHPKVKVTTKTRGQGLIEDMTKGGSAGIAEGPKTRSTADKDKEKEKEKGKEVKDKEKDKENSTTEATKSKSSAKSSSPDTATPPSGKIKKKRTSSESSTTPDAVTDSKRLKLSIQDGQESMETDDEPVPPTPDTPITPPVRKAGLMESSLFMDALTATTAIASSARERRMKRKSSSTIESPAAAVGAGVGKGAAPAASPVTNKPVFNFYRETLTSECEDGEGQQPEDLAPADSPPGGATPEAEPEDDVIAEEGGTTATPTRSGMKVRSKSKPAGELKSILHMHRLSSVKGPKKSVQWVPDHQLEDYCYFEMDETERINVTKGNGQMLGGFGVGISAEVEIDEPPVLKPTSFAEMKLLEKAQEKKLVKRKLFGAVDIMEEKVEWSSPKRVDLEGKVQENEILSKEIALQEDREKGTLQVFYFTKRDIPDCPDESLALSENFDPTQAPSTVIPVDDIPGLTKITMVETPEEQQRTVQQQILLQQQQQAMQQGFGIPTSGGFDLGQQSAAMNLWGAGGVGQGAAAAAAANPFALAMALAGAAAAAANGGLDPAAAAAAAWGSQGFQQPPPSMLNPNYITQYNTGAQSHQNQDNQGYDDYGGVNDQQQPYRTNQGGGGGRGGRGGGRRQFSRFDNSGGGGGGRNQQGGGGRWDDNRQGGGGDRRNNRGGHHRDDGGARGRGGRDFRGGRGGGHDDKRDRGSVIRTVLCKFYAQGTCKAGENCDFLHPGVNGPKRGGRYNNHGGGGGGGNDWRPARGGRRDAGGDRGGGGGGGMDGGYSSVQQEYQSNQGVGVDEQDTSPASPEPASDFGSAAVNHQPIEFRDGES